MKYRPLGRTGLLVSEIGFGCWGIGGVTAGATSYGEVDDTVSLKALDRALDLGVNFYDTSNLYGDGHSEDLLGQAFGKRRDKVIIATKVGRSDYDTEAYSPVDLRRSIEGSLRRLRTDYVDVVEVHSPSSIEALKQTEVMATLNRLKGEGKIRAIGVSVKAPAEGVPAIKELGAEVIQVNFNLVDQRASEGDVLAVARIAGIMAAKKTAELIPLCHPLPLSGVKLDLAPDDKGIIATATVSTTHGTGVEMEAITAVSIALVTIYDMAKALDRGMVIGDVRLLAKSGGRSGDWRAP